MIEMGSFCEIFVQWFVVDFHIKYLFYNYTR